MARTRMIAVAGVALVAALVGSAASARLSQPAPTPTEQMVADEIDAMLDAGLDEDDPKVASLSAELEAMRRSDPHGPGEPGVDLGEHVDRARAGDARERSDRRRSTGRVDAADTAAWDRGEVECEPIPGLLTAEEVAGAVCVSLPRPDGTARYLAVGPDRVAHVVRFADDGIVERLEDQQLAVDVAPGATRLRPTPGGHLEITPRGQGPVVAEVP